MTLSALLIWLVVGLIAGWLASLIVGGGGGILWDILVGILGAYVGGQLFRVLGLRVPLRGLPGTILVAVIGAIVFLLLLRTVLRLLRSG